MVKLALAVGKRRQLIGPVTRTWYLFDPWCEVDEKDVEGLRGLRVKHGCECTGNARFEQFIATEDEIASGKVKPKWDD